MRKSPTIYRLGQLVTAANLGTRTEINGNWVPARPIGFFSIRHRVKAAWLVFTGKADAVIWPGGQ